MTDTADLVALVEPEARALGFDLVRVMLFGAGEERTFQIMAERPDTRQLGIDDCAALSRRISEKLGALEEAGNDSIEGAYRLEVSSPGIDRPLTRDKDYSDWAGHEARLNLAEPVAGRKQLTGELHGLEGGHVILTDKKSGKVEVPLASIHSAKLMLTDKLIAATVPLSADGAEEEIDTISDEEGQD